MASGVARNNGEEEARRRRPPLWAAASGALLLLLALRCGGTPRASFRGSPPYGVATREDARAAGPPRLAAASSRPARLFRDYRDVAPVPDDVGNASVYETLWPGERLYGWARKARGHRRDGAPRPPPPGTSTCFVHVGKTGGSTVGCALGFRLHCTAKGHFDGLLPNATTHMFHGDVYDCPGTSDLYLFAVRDPLARLRSAFVYGRTFERRKGGAMGRRSKTLYDACPFPTLHELAARGLAPDGNASAVCKERARAMVRGTELTVFHAYYNYQAHLEAIPHGARLLAMRNEQMAEDWNAIEALLGGAPTTNRTFPRNNSQRKKGRDRRLGDRERRLLCRELCVEIQYYKLLLRQARNIRPGQYATSLAELRTSCPDEARRRQCDVHTPNIRDKLLLVRGRRRDATRRQRR